LDSSGNASIINDQLRIVVKGEKNRRLSAEFSKPSRLFKESGIKLLFGFLTNPEMINYTYREMQNVIDLSLGAIKNSIEEMQENGYLLINEEKRILKKRTELLERWTISYNETLKPKLFLKRMSFKENTHWKDIKLLENTNWSGEPASSLLNGFLIPEDFTIYTKEKISQLVKLGLRG